MAPPRLKSGGALREGMLYVERPADEELPRVLAEGEFCYVLAPRQIGKSSLRVHTMARLGRQGVRCAAIDLTSIGSGVTIEQWYFGFLSAVAEELELPHDPDDFWRRHPDLPPVQRWSRYWRAEVLSAVPAPIVIFVDEIDAVLGFDFPRDDFFAAIRALYNRRSDDPEYTRLAFCLLGVAAPGDLMADPKRTPFNIGRAIRLEDFTRAEVRVFAPALAPLGGDPAAWLDEIYAWTRGHPYMTQKVCEELLAIATRPGAAPRAEPLAQTVAQIVERLFFRRGRVEDPNLGAAESAFTRADKNPRIDPMLRLYRRLLAGEAVPSDGADPVHQALRLTGMTAERRDTGEARLAVRNRIFATVFDDAWAKRKEAERYIAAPLERWLAAGRSDDFLLRGEALRAAREWSRTRSDLGPEETEFIMTGLELGRREEEARRQAELERERRERAEAEARSRRRTIAGLMALLSLVSAALGLALWQYRQARAAQTQAEAATQAATVSAQREQAARRQAEAAAAQARASEQDARRSAAEREAARARAEDNARQAQRERARAEENARRAEDSAQQAQQERQRAEENAHKAEQERRRAEDSAQKARAAQELAEQAAGREATAYKVAEEGRLIEKALRARLLAEQPGMHLQALVAGMQALSPLLPGEPAILSRVGEGLVAAARQVVAWQPLAGQTPGVSSVAVSPNDTLVAAACDDKTVRLWELPSGRARPPLTGHTGKVWSVAFSPDGKQLASASADGTVRLWDTATGRTLRTLRGQGAALLATTFSPSGQYVAAGDANGIGWMWDAVTGELALGRPFNLPSVLDRIATPATTTVAAIWSIAFSPKDGRLAFGLGDGNVRFVRLDRLNEYRRFTFPPGSPPFAQVLTGHADRVSGLAFSPDGVHMLTASADGTARLWDANTGRLVRTYTGHSGPLAAAVFTHDGHTIATASSDGTARLWDNETGRTLLGLEGHENSVRAVAFTSDAAHLLTGGADGTVRAWDLAGGQAALRLVGHTSSVYSAAFSPDGQRIVTGSNDGTARLWNAGTGHLLRTLMDKHPAPIGDAEFSPDGHGILTASHDAMARLWNERGEVVLQLKGHASWIGTAVYAPDGTKIVTASNDQTARLWDAQSGRPLAVLQGHTGTVYTAAFSPDNSRVITASADKTARLWDAQNGRLLRTLGDEAAEIHSAAFAPDGVRAVTAQADGSVTLWDTRTGAVLRALQGHTDHVWSATFSPDGTRLVTASSDGTVRLWDAGSGDSLLVITGYARAFADVSFSPDGRRILATASNDVALVFPATAAGWFAFGCRVLRYEEHIKDVPAAELDALKKTCQPYLGPRR
ncbi:MAG TPA: AAA-like domain-containing protein [Polyangia bacterium]|jgi:WD40 repeat protein|nr:AAA-like domain-containing protein [Polyangia bacterium]